MSTQLRFRDITKFHENQTAGIHKTGMSVSASVDRDLLSHLFQSRYTGTSRDKHVVNLEPPAKRRITGPTT